MNRLRPRYSRFLLVLRLVFLGLVLGTTAAAQVTRSRSTPPSDAGQRGAGLGAPVTRFVALGDTGEGNLAQFQVAAAIGTVHTRLGVDFALLLGDNFYDTGVDSVDDSQFQTKFVEPYGPLGFPFHVILGNHDYGASLMPDFSKGDYQVAYSAVNPQWVMPATHYRFGTETAFFVGLDTHRVFHGIDAQQRSDVASWMGEAGTRWKIALGHHPYLSNGPHGNAGTYEGIPNIPIVSGADVQDFVEDLVVGQFDVYLSGHDHSLQHLRTGGTAFIVSGSGSKTTALPGSNPTLFQAEQTGFFHFEARRHTLVIRAYDAEANLLHYRVLQK